MSTAVLRRVAAVRPNFAVSHVPGARFSSSSTEGAQKAAQDVAGKTKEKAEEAYKVAQKTASSVYDKAVAAAGPLGQKVTGLLGGYREPIVYNLSVAKELVKQVYVAEGLAPPTSVSAVQSVYKTLFERARNPNFWVEAAQNGQAKVILIYALEAYGIFSIGEIVGRGSLVGYNLS